VAEQAGKNMALQVLKFDDPGWRSPGAAVPEVVQKLVSTDFVPPAGLLLIGHDAESKEKIVATAGFRRVTEAVCEARNVVVFWGYQQKGVGRAMMERLLAEARAAGYRGMRAEAPAEIAPLAAFYLKMGFVRSPPEFQRPGFVRFERAL
jgi:GNAT superfamily N-acetyltransferase